MNLYDNNFYVNKKMQEKMIVGFFQNSLAKIKTEIVKSIQEDKFLECFSYYLCLSKFGSMPHDALKVLDEMFVVMFGKTYVEILELTEKRAENFFNEISSNPGKPLSNKLSLTDEEHEAVTEYYKFLFAIHKKNPEPFNLNT